MKPITPKEAKANKKFDIPGVVLEVVDELITQGLCSGSVTIKQDDIVKILVKSKGLKQAEIFDKGWLNIEGVYEKAGWKVEYDKPGYNESYPATFTFRAKRSTASR